MPSQSPCYHTACYRAPSPLGICKKGSSATHTLATTFCPAVGGRPAPLSCPGGELAMSSDDIFQTMENPGKVCVVGASYVALECAGFLTALGFDVTVLVRSILL